MKAILLLEDGKSFTAEAMGACGERIGQVIFNTAVVGYQEMLTDPANAGKILVLTYPLIGNYGCAPKFNESKKIWPAALVIKEKTRISSNWQARQSFDDYVKENKLFVAYELDTRTLMVHLRQKGELLGIVSTEDFETKRLLSKIEAFRKNQKESFLPQVSVKNPVILRKGRSKKRNIAVLDLGITKSITHQLEAMGFNLEIFPYNTQPKDILRHRPIALVLSGGPEEQAGLDKVADNIRALIGRLPILGISCGHQVLAKALGGTVSKLKIGHRGVNYPIADPASYKGEITTQNHAYTVDAESLEKIRDIKITAHNLNDRSVEEIESKKLKVIGAQYYPCSPGLGETNNIFKRFAKMLK
ncbi:MAG: glutamine-hydrolyzing carbamoyl-phosphate synthase small subunit [Candidatus Omnitrophica bacterium]|nr:glutamine-hydrolyzing carbamoyl-phosphate synthase small subunit [Candidatus Omnitrophota bacterium]